MLKNKKIKKPLRFLKLNNLKEIFGDVYHVLKTTEMKV